MDFEADDQRYQDMLSEAYRKAMENVVWAGDEPLLMPAEQLLSAGLSDANRRIFALEQENAKLRDDLRKLLHAAAHPPVIGEAPAEFPANCLRWSV